LKRIVIIGAGGFAREVRWLIEDINMRKREYEFAGYVVSDLSKVGEHDSLDQIVGDYSWLSKQKGDIYATLGIGNPAARLKVSGELHALSKSIHFPALIHPSVQFDRGSCEVGEGVIVCAGTIGTVNLQFKPFCMVNLACTVGHESVLGRGVVMNPTVNISGGVTLGDGVLVGTGAQILQYISIGENAVVGAGSVVTKDVEPGRTVVGIPAKPLEKKMV
jgi:sugar O-acyltransferase (sialic acid O-acetyltransferase NeuD family)